MEAYKLTQKQIDTYLVQPDNLSYFSRSVEDNLEYNQYLKGTTFRFWYNTQQDSFKPHWHTAFEVIMPVDQDYEVTLQQEVYHLSEGDILIIPSGCIHSLRPLGDGARIILIFEIDYISQLPGFNYIMSMLSHALYIPYNEDSKFYSTQLKTIQRLLEYYWNEAVTKDMNIYATLIQFFANIGDYTVNAAASPSVSTAPAKAGTLVNRLSMVLDYLDTHYSENITLEEAANIACFSKFYFTRLFKQYTNQTFYDYLSAKRIKAAEQMLIVPNFPITEISLKSGFSSLSSFNRTFKRLKGCSPSEYRSLYCLYGHKDSTQDTKLISEASDAAAEAEPSEEAEEVFEE